jgi:hypothetical protein
MTKAREPRQQEFLREAKAMLEMTWDELAEAAEIKPRALKNYRLPDDSQDHRNMPLLARRAVENLLASHVKKNRRKAA